MIHLRSYWLFSLTSTKNIVFETNIYMWYIYIIWLNIYYIKEFLMNQIKTKIATIFVMILVLAIGLNVPSLASSDLDNTVFTCQEEGTGLSPVAVLEATDQHAIFLSLLEEHDQEGYDILSDPLLADKTIWAPIDSTFEQIGNV